MWYWCIFSAGHKMDKEKEEKNMSLTRVETRVCENNVEKK
jgi:hypothetical protein